MPEQDTFTSNSILSRLSDADSERIRAHVTEIPLRVGSQVLGEGYASYAFFPLKPAVISLVRQDANGGTVETGIVGSEGFASISALLDPRTQPERGVIQGEGSVLRIEAAVLRELAESSPNLRHALLNFINYFTIQLGQTALCNRLHTIERRLGRWLLMMRDRVGSEELKLTQEFLSHMLGARVAGVNEAVQALGRNGLIRHARQKVTILDEQALTKASCGCYVAIRAEYDRIRN